MRIIVAEKNPQRVGTSGTLIGLLVRACSVALGRVRCVVLLCCFFFLVSVPDGGESEEEIARGGQ